MKTGTKLRWMTSAALALGAAVAVPSFARADHFRDGYRDYHDGYRDSYRDGYRERVVVVRERDAAVCDDVDVTVPLREVPDRVMRTIDCERHGRPIEAVNFVRRDGRVFYRVRLEGWRDRDTDLRIAADGGVLSVSRSAPEYRDDRGDDWRWRR